jgi:hypothetical protein
VSGLLCSSSFDWGLLDEMPSASLSFIHFMAGVGHERGINLCAKEKQ